jgi:hypothetical protein
MLTGMQVARTRSRAGAGTALFAGLALLAIAGHARATTYWVSPGGLAGNPGTSAARPWPLERANALLGPGDVCRLLPGAYSTPIAPANGGASIASRVTYVGSLTDPSAATVTAIHSAKPFVTIAGVRASEGLVLMQGAVHDSVYRCVIAGGLELQAAKRCVLAANVVAGKVAFLANDGRPCYTSQRRDPACVANCEYDTLRRNVIDLGPIRPGDRSFEFKAWTQRCLLDSNRVSGTFDDAGSSLADGGIAVVTYNSYLLTFRANHWQFEAVNNHHAWPNTTWDAFYLRDSLHTTLFESDTILAGVNTPDPYEIRCTMSATGSFPGGVRNVTMRGCVIRSKGDIMWQGGFDHWTLERCVLQSLHGTPLYLLSDWVGSRIRRCTVWAGGEALRMEGPGGGRHVLGSGNEVVSNIFYSLDAGALNGTGGVVMWKDNTGGFVSDRNLYFARHATGEARELAIVWSGYFSSRPGAGGRWNALTRQDGQSAWGSPRFADSTWATFDPRLRMDSRAIGLGGVSDAVGAVAYDRRADTTPPAIVSNLAADHVDATSLVLAWTAPVDDGVAGRVDEYDARYATTAITAASFGAARRLVPSPVPQPRGQRQAYVVTALTPGTRYWFALRARDEAGNWSGVSNVVRVVTAAR